MSDTSNTPDGGPEPAREREASAKADRVVSGAKPPRGVTSVFTSLDYDDETLRTKEKIAGAIAAIMILGPLFFGWSGIGR